MQKYISLKIFIIVMLITGIACAPSFKRFKTINNAPHEWNMFRNSLNGYYQKGIYGGYIDKLAWKGSMKAKCYSTPVATDSYVAVAALDTYMYFFDRESGERINMFRFRAPTCQSPLISNKIMYAAAGPNKNFIAGINLITGKYIFKESMQDVSAPLIGDDKFLFCGDYSGRFVCLDKFSGKVVWEFQAGGPILNAPAVLGDKIFVGSMDKMLYALDYKSGEKLWEFQANGAINSAPAADRNVYFGSYDNYVYCVDADSGRAVWKFKTGGQIVSSPVIDDEFVYIGSNDRKVYCLDKFSGEKIWELETKGIVNSTPLVLEDVVVIGSGDGVLYMLHKANGTPIFTYETEHMIVSSPIFFDGQIYVSSVDQHLYCFRH